VVRTRRSGWARWNRIDELDQKVAASSAGSRRSGTGGEDLWRKETGHRRNSKPGRGGAENRVDENHLLAQKLEAQTVGLEEVVIGRKNRRSAHDLRWKRRCWRCLRALQLDFLVLG
jgi:hypothetical protein